MVFSVRIKRTPVRNFDGEVPEPQMIHTARLLHYPQQGAELLARPFPLQIMKPFH
jgi:hypothetical protein